MPSIEQALCPTVLVQGALVNANIQEFLDRIQQLEAAIEQEAKSCRQKWQADFEEHKVRFEKEVLAQQKRFKEGLLVYVLNQHLRLGSTHSIIYAINYVLLNDPPSKTTSVTEFSTGTVRMAARVISSLVMSACRSLASRRLMVKSFCPRLSCALIESTNRFMCKLIVFLLFSFAKQL
jgi:hypothetical protein